MSSSIQSTIRSSQHSQSSFAWFNGMPLRRCNMLPPICNLITLSVMLSPWLHAWFLHLKMLVWLTCCTSGTRINSHGYHRASRILGRTPCFANCLAIQFSHQALVWFVSDCIWLLSWNVATQLSEIWNSLFLNACHFLNTITLQDYSLFWCIATSVHIPYFSYEMVATCKFSVNTLERHLLNNTDICCL
jgi:hypothetical protein